MNLTLSGSLSTIEPIITRKSNISSSSGYTVHPAAVPTYGGDAYPFIILYTPFVSFTGDGSALDIRIKVVGRGFTMTITAIDVVAIQVS